jgi:hypothetical protein
MEENLKDGAVRDRIVETVDAALVQSQPEARLVPPGVRRRIIRRLLDLLLDEILLAE